MSDWITRAAARISFLPAAASPAKAATPATKAAAHADGLALSTGNPAAQAMKLNPAQTAAFEKLGPGAQAQFQKVFDSTNGVGRMHLRGLLEKGTLNARDGYGGRTLLSHLHDLATKPVAGGLDKGELIQNLAQQTLDPGEISQGGRGTCVPTTMEYILAKTRPAEYARLVVGVASPAGTVPMMSGAILKRNPGTEQRDDSGRTAASRLFEAAMMDYANFVFDYNNQTDKNGVAGIGIIGGLPPSAGKRMINAMLNENRRVVEAVPFIGQIPFTAIGGSRVLKAVQEATARGVMVPAGLDWRGIGEWRPAGHEICVITVENGRVYYRNPWGPDYGKGRVTDGKDGPVRRIEDNGGMESMTVAEFTARAKSALVP